MRAIAPSLGRTLIERHHYAGGVANTATACHGLVHRRTLTTQGVAWWIPPTRGAALAHWDQPDEVLCLSRMVILPGAPTNAATFLMMRSVALIDARWKCLLAYADTEQGHTGGIYKAAGWEDRGLSEPTDVWIDSRGRRVARKAGPKTRTHKEMRRLGYTLRGYFAKHRWRLIRRRFPQPVPYKNWQMNFFDVLEGVA